MKLNTTYIVQLTSESRYGSNQAYYFRTEAEAKRHASELREWFKSIPTQKITITSHNFSNQ